MYTVYVLKNQKDGNRYVGFTSKNVYLRVQWHKEGSNKSTKFLGPFELVHFEEFADQHIALSREKFLKTGRGRRVLDNILSRRETASWAS